MSDASQEIKGLLSKVQQGRLDDLTPGQVAELEAWLRTRPAEEARLADTHPPLEGWLTALLPPPPPPSPAEWRRVWAEVERAAASRTSLRHRLIPVGQGLAALAACVLLAASWHALRPPRVERIWALRPTGHVQIDSLELFGDTTVLVDTGAEDGGLPVIWVLDTQGV
jgi:hypothetical protein